MHTQNKCKNLMFDVIIGIKNENEIGHGPIEHALVELPMHYQQHDGHQHVIIVPNNSIIIHTICYYYYTL